MVERNTIVSTVTFTRGMGDSGQKLNLIKETTCNVCGYDRQLEHVRVSPVEQDIRTTKCMHPTCPDYHDDEWGYLTRGI